MRCMGSRDAKVKALLLRGLSGGLEGEEVGRRSRIPGLARTVLLRHERACSVHQSIMVAHTAYK